MSTVKHWNVLLNNFETGNSLNFLINVTWRYCYITTLNPKNHLKMRLNCIGMHIYVGMLGASGYQATLFVLEYWGFVARFVSCMMHWLHIHTHMCLRWESCYNFLSWLHFECTRGLSNRNSNSRAWLTLSNAAIPGNILPLRNSHTIDSFSNAVYCDEESDIPFTALHAALPTKITSQLLWLALFSIWPNCVAPTENSSVKSKLVGPIHRIFCEK